MKLTMLLLTVSACALAAQPDSSSQSYTASIDAWHAKRIESLKREHGWLSLIALEWLHQGKNDIPHFGTLMFENGKATLELSHGVQATVDGKPFLGGSIRVEGDSGGAQKIFSGTKAFTLIKRGERFAMRMWDSEAGTRKHFHGIDRYPVNPQWRIEAAWTPYDHPRRVQIETVIPGFIEDDIVPGVAVFTLGGTEYRLEPVLEEPGADFFFIFGDKTNGKETYGAGRFMYTPPAQGGKVILDFNKAYNPPCAFTEFATCPLPPKGNKLSIRIDAGEKKYGEH
ncbi:MAG: DUF1684 domain-containing protein [Ignavibacteriales bacterium]|nr:DUF1684 domain-containing protein [Ignavibacteriales bacterium]